MEWGWIFAIAVIGYFIYKYLQDNNPDNKIEKFEERAETLYQTAIQSADKQIKSTQELLADEKMMKLVMSKPEEVKKRLKDDEEFKQSIVDTKHNYSRSKERFKHHNGNERVKLAQDWWEYVLTINSMFNQQKILEYSDSDSAYEDFRDSITELRIKKEEIERRFDRRLRSDV